jgi:hypothetical protein
MDTVLEAIWTLSWRAWPAALVSGVGLWLVVYGILRERPGIRLPVSDPHKGVALVRALRSVLVGLALAGIGIAWTWHLPCVLGLCCIIGGEEALETSVVIAALRDAEQKGVWRAPAPAPR